MRRSLSISLIWLLIVALLWAAPAAAQYSTPGAAGTAGGACATNGMFAWPDPNGQILKCNSGTWAVTLGTTGIWSLNGSNAYYSGGNVGIGTNSPSSRLHVFSNVGGESAPPSASIGMVSVWRNDSANDVIGVYGQATVNSASYHSYGGYFQGVNGSAGTGVGLYAIGNPAAIFGGNVGIGTTSPANKLDVNGAATIGYGNGTSSPSNGLAVSGSVGIGAPTAPGTLSVSGPYSNTAGSRKAIEILSNATNEWWSWGLDTSGDLMLDNVHGTAANAMTVTVGGNIGIGTTSPQATLDVNGYARLLLNSSQPVACSSTKQGAFALNHLAQACACNGSTWIFADSTGAACSW